MKRVVGTVFLLIAAVVLAGELPQPVTGLKVSLPQVVEVGKVLPVDGISSAGLPDEAALKVFRDSGYVAVIDLRGANEKADTDEQRIVNELGMDYVPLPISGGTDITFDNAQLLDNILKKYHGPVLVHCASGNRVGALLALRLSLQGADDDLALATGRAAGLTSLDETVQQRLAEQ
ncbi:MAG TPA: sulfur transferase domain-containing protein [Woeseiaceae bacterium]|nr:sulfur transferase domain-containing protein [Woeseiaceae bacterium]